MANAEIKAADHKTDGAARLQFGRGCFSSHIASFDWSVNQKSTIASRGAF